MTGALNKPRYARFLVLSGLVLLSNYSLYRLPIIQPIPEQIAIGSVFDLFVTLPALSYFFIIRNRYSFKLLGIVILIAYGLSYLIIPIEQLREYKFTTYIFGFSEGFLFLFELYLLFQFFKKVPALISEVNHLNQQNSLFQYNLRKSVNLHIPNSRFAKTFVTEISLFYYAIFSWGKKTRLLTGTPFTYHKQTSMIALYIMLIHATFIETIGLHYLLHQWNEIASYVLLFLNIYGILYFIGEIQATRLSPFLITEDKIVLQVGLSKSLEIPIEEVHKINFYSGPEKFSKQDYKTMFDGRVNDFMQKKPNIEMTLKEKQTVHLMYGFTKQVTRVVLFVDAPIEFYQKIKEKMEETGT